MNTSKQNKQIKFQRSWRHVLATRMISVRWDNQSARVYIVVLFNVCHPVQTTPSTERPRISKELLEGVTADKLRPSSLVTKLDRATEPFVIS